MKTTTLLLRPISESKFEAKFEGPRASLKFALLEIAESAGSLKFVDPLGRDNGRRFKPADPLWFLACWPEGWKEFVEIHGILIRL